MGSRVINRQYSGNTVLMTDEDVIENDNGSMVVTGGHSTAVESPLANTCTDLSLSLN